MITPEEQTLLIDLFPQVVTILVITLVFSFAARFLMQRLKVSKVAPEWLKLIGNVCYSPIAWIIAVYGTLVAGEVVVKGAELPMLSRMIPLGRSIFVIIVITWLFLRWKLKLEKHLITTTAHRPSSANDRALIFALGRLASILILVIAGLSILSVLDIGIEAFLALGGIGGLAIGLAGKEVLANFFGGLMIFVNRPFSAGEWIYSPNKNFEGVVEHIGWYMTQIRTFDRRPMYIPNALITDAIVQNPQRMYNRRIKATIGIRYDDVNKTAAIVDDIRTMLREHPAIDQDQLLFVHLVEFGPSSLNIEVYTFTKTTVWGEWRDIQQEVFLKIANIITSHGAEIAFPTTTVHLPDNPLETAKNPR